MNIVFVQPLYNFLKINPQHSSDRHLYPTPGRISGLKVRFRAEVWKGVSVGRRPDLVGGGLLRSMGGWTVLKELRKADIRVKGDERILGDNDFVKKTLFGVGPKAPIKTGKG